MRAFRKHTYHSSRTCAPLEMASSGQGTRGIWLSPRQVRPQLARPCEMLPALSPVSSNELFFLQKLVCGSDVVTQLCGTAAVEESAEAPLFAGHTVR